MDQINVIELDRSSELSWRYELTNSEDFVGIECGKTLTSGNQVIVQIKQDLSIEVIQPQFAKVSGM